MKVRRCIISQSVFYYTIDSIAFNLFFHLKMTDGNKVISRKLSQLSRLRQTLCSFRAASVIGHLTLFCSRLLRSKSCPFMSNNISAIKKELEGGGRISVPVDTSKSYKCSKCPHLPPFGTRSERDRHVESQHKKSFQLKISDGVETTIYKDEATELYFCPQCPGATDGFSRSDALARHYAKFHRPGAASKVDEVIEEKLKKRKQQQQDAGMVTDVSIILPIDESETPTNILTTCLRQTTTSTNVDGERATFLVCIECSCVLAPVASTVVNHVNNHKLANRLAKQTKAVPNDNCSPTSTIVTSITEFVNNSNFTSHSSRIAKLWLQPNATTDVLLPPVAGVPIRIGFQCVTCGKCLLALASCKKHICSNGIGNFSSVPVQALTNGIARQYVRVHYETHLTTALSNIDKQLSEDAKIIASLGSRDLPMHKERDAWLRVSQWPEIAATFIPEGTSFADIDLHLKPSNRDNDPLRCVLDLLSTYMAKAHTVVNAIEYQFRRRVMDSDKNGLPPSQGFRVLSVESTCKRYCKYLSRLLTGLLREHQINNSPNKTKLLGDLTSEQRLRCNHLMDYLRNPDAPCSPYQLSQLHEFLLALWTPATNNFIEVRARSKSVLGCFLLLSSLKPSFGDKGYAFQHVSTVTGRCSTLIYWIRLTILMEIGRSLWDDGFASAIEQE